MKPKAPTAHRHSNASQIQELRYKSVSQEIQIQNIPNKNLMSSESLLQYTTLSQL